MDPRRYELATLAAARTLGSSYCMLAHGKVLLGQGVSETDLIGIAAGVAGAPLTETERAIMDYAATVARDAGAVGPEIIAGLRALGLSDSEIFDVAAAAAARCFFSKLLDALGALPDAAYGELPPDLRAALAIGRPIDGG
jgi:AhpD family alkylhydroperoxidase